MVAVEPIDQRINSAQIKKTEPADLAYLKEAVASDLFIAAWVLDRSIVVGWQGKTSINKKVVAV